MPYEEVLPYKEVQRFTGNKIMLAVLIPLGLSLLFMGYGVIRQVFFGQAFGNQPMPNSGLVIMFFVLVLLLLWFLQLRLITHLTKEGITVHFSSLGRFKRSIPYTAIKDIESITYNGLTEHGGWGWRIGPFGTAFTVYGNEAVKLTMQNQKTNLSKAVYIGTQNADALEAAIKNHLSS